MSKNQIKLNLLGLPVIQNIEDFSRLTHISKYTIYQLSINSNKYYKTYEITKKSGGKRIISQPSKNLKGLQSWILVNILNKVKVSSSCTGFRKGSSTLDNANPHKGANTLLNIDIKNFFDTVTSKQVLNVFKTIGYNNLISTLFTNICTFDNKLPQGGPCSPMLANLVTWTLDLRIQGFVGKKGITYTRYADDLTFSGLNPEKVVKLLPTLKKIIEDEKFLINEKKTRIASSARAKTVTGLIINEDCVGIGKKKFKLLRAKIHTLALNYNLSDQKELNHIKGWLSYLNSVDKKRYLNAKKYISSLAKKAPSTLVVLLEDHFKKVKLDPFEPTISTKTFKA